jgi:cardiolipin synthase
VAGKIDAGWAPALPFASMSSDRDAPSLREAHSRELARCLGDPLVGGNRVTLLEDGPDAFAAMLGAIDAARDHVNVESYIVEAEGPGAEVQRRLIERARAGVRVNLLFDGFGSLRTDARFFRALRDAGVVLCEYNPLRSWQVLAGRALHWRDHRKLMVVDGRVGFIGGVNIASVYASGSAPLGAAHGRAAQATARAREPGWRDLHVRVDGPVVARLQHLFVQHWERHARCALGAADYFPPLHAAGTQDVAVAASDAGHRRNPHYRALLCAIAAARASVRMMTAYLAPPRRLLHALVRAAERGVGVELLLPGKSDSWAALHAGRSHFSRLLRAGVHIYERHDTTLHAKACVVDGLWASIGSSNLDWRSVLHNAEANLVLLDEAFAAEIERVFRADLRLARRIDLERWHRRSRWSRWQESLARRFEFLL